jgi:hypothetical protein
MATKNDKRQACVILRIDGATFSEAIAGVHGAFD